MAFLQNWKDEQKQVQLKKYVRTFEQIGAIIDFSKRTNTKYCLWDDAENNISIFNSNIKNTGLYYICTFHFTILIEKFAEFTHLGFQTQPFLSYFNTSIQLLHYKQLPKVSNNIAQFYAQNINHLT